MAENRNNIANNPDISSARRADDNEYSTCVVDIAK